LLDDDIEENLNVLDAVLRRDGLEIIKAHCSPRVPGLKGDDCINVHSKLMVVDDRLLKVGSSNLSNRSMGLDTECDLAIDAVQRGRDSDRMRVAIGRARDRVLGEHLATSPRRIAAEWQAGSTLGSIIDRRRGATRCLEPLREMFAPALDLTILSGALTDPERPMDAAEFAEQFVVDEAPRVLGRLLRWAGPRQAVVAIGLASIAFARALRRARPAQCAAPREQSALPRVAAASM
jgi:phospholipase D1/2